MLPTMNSRNEVSGSRIFDLGAWRQFALSDDSKLGPSLLKSGSRSQAGELRASNRVASEHFVVKIARERHPNLRFAKEVEPGGRMPTTVKGLPLS